MKHIKEMINQTLTRLGYRISKIDPDYILPKDMKSAVESIARHFQINTIIDVGASSGIWSNMVMEYFPQSQFLLIEAQPIHKDALEAILASRKNSQFVLAAAGNKQGQIYFNAADPYGARRRTRLMRMTTSLSQLPLLMMKLKQRI